MFRIFFAALIVVACISGCGKKDGPETVKVAGTVNWNGEKLEAGDIQFIPATNPSAKPYAARIEKGAFALELEPGPKKVMITSSRDVPGKTIKDAIGKESPVREQFIPAKYNTSTTLQQSIERPTSDLKFDLTEK